MENGRAFTPVRKSFGNFHCKYFQNSGLAVTGYSNTAKARINAKTGRVAWERTLESQNLGVNSEYDINYYNLG